jgi:uridylate kinase
MDSTAFTLSQENKLPIVIFDMNKQGNLLKSVRKHRNCSKYISP